VPRNAPCPCGSGRRYKECHGALAAAAAVGTDAAAWVPQVMREALRAQRDGRMADAARSYRRVLDAQPSNFDAAHMLSLVEYEIGHYDEAVVLMRRAIELRPELGAPRKNMRLLESMPMMETEICREVLPRMLARIDTTFAPARLAAARSVHVVSPLGPPECAALREVLPACGSATVELWDDTGTESLAGTITAKRLTADAYPRGGWLVLLGTVRSVADWLPKSGADGAVVVVTRDQPCAAIDRIDELAATGYTRAALSCATPALGRRLGLPASMVWTFSVDSNVAS
jgi:tetratricopeptide (TPR) repeat protein